MATTRWAPLATLALTAALLAAVPGGGHVGHRGAPSEAGSRPGAVAAGFPRLAPYFEANHGQAGPGVGFVVRGGGLSVALSATEARLEMAGPDGPSRLGMHLVGADPAAHQVGQEPLATTVNHYAGPDPSRWLTGIPTYGRVRTRGAYPGIDLVWHGRPGALEYDFVVGPGADPARIRLGFDGATGLRLDGGDLVVGVAGGEVRQRAPVAYQTVGGRRRGVESRFVVEGDQVGFAVGPYDRRRPLVIDPVLAYAGLLGGGGDDRLADVAVDGAGNAYVVGSATMAPWSLVEGSGPSARVGAAMAYHPGTAKAVLFGGRGPSGEILGDTWAFDGTAWGELAVPGPPARAYAGLAYEPTTARLVLFGGEDGAGALADTWVFDGSAWSQLPAVGASPPARSRAALATYQLLGAQGVVLFGGRGADGELLGDTWAWNGVAWAQQAPATVPAPRSEAAVGTDGAGRPHVFGGKGEAGVLGDLWTWSGATWERRAEDAVVAPPARKGAVLVGDDAGALRLVGGKAGGTLLADRWTYRAGNAKPWAKEKKMLVPVPGPRVGAGAARHAGAGVGLVAAGKGPDGPSADTWALEPSTPQVPGFVAKLDPTGRALDYVTYLDIPVQRGGHGSPDVDIAVDAAGSAYVAGSAISTGLATTAGAYQPACRLAASGECSDAFVVVLAPTGALRYGTYLGGTRTEYVRGVALGPGGTVYLAGRVDSMDLPTTAGAYQPACGFSVEGQCGDAFVAKLAPAGNGAADLVYATYYGATTASVDGEGLAVDGEGVAYLTGSTRATDLPTTPGAYQRACVVNDQGSCLDAFVAKLAPAGEGAGDLRYSTYLGGGCCNGGGSDFSRAVGVGPGGSVYLAGVTGSTDFPVTPGAFDTTFKCFSDAGCIGFVAVLDPAGAGNADLVYSTYMGGGSDTFHDLVVDGRGRAVVSGKTFSSSFPVRKAVQKTCGCAAGATIHADAVVFALDPSVLGDGSGRVSSTNQALRFSTFLGGSKVEAGYAVAVDGTDDIYVVGTTSSPDFPVTAGAFQTRFAGTWDGFVAKISGVP
ncbi:MAG: Kelch repeat-containing protein [Acidimicrobiales bacterium]